MDVFAPSRSWSRSGRLLSRRALVNEYRSIKLPYGLGPFPVLISNSRRRPADPLSLVETYLFSLLPTLSYSSLRHTYVHNDVSLPLLLVVLAGRWRIRSPGSAYIHACTRAYIECMQRWLIDRESTLFYWLPVHYVLPYSWPSIAACVRDTTGALALNSTWQHRG